MSATQYESAVNPDSSQPIPHLQILFSERFSNFIETSPSIIRELLYDNIYTVHEHRVTLKTIEEPANAQPEEKRERGIEIATCFNHTTRYMRFLQGAFVAKMTQGTNKARARQLGQQYAYTMREDEVRLTTNYYELLVDWPWLICYGSWTVVAQRSAAARREFAQQLNEVKATFPNLPSL